MRAVLGRCVLLVCGLSIALPGLAASPPPGTQIVSESVASYSDAAGTPYPSETASVMTEVSSGAVLGVALSAAPGWVQGNDVLTWTIVATNSGSNDATGIAVGMQLAPEVAFESATGDGVHDAATRRIRWPDIDLPAGASQSYTVTTRVDASIGTRTDGAQIISTAVVGTTGIVLDTDSAIARIGRSAKLSVSKRVDSQRVAPGGELSYGITVLNSGNLASIDTRILDTLPEGVSLIPKSLALPFTLDGQTLEIQAGNLASGSSLSANFAVTVSASAQHGQELRNQASASAQGLEPVSSNEVVSVIDSGRDLTLSGTSTPEQVHPGGSVVYALRVSNSGDQNLDNLRLRHPLPADTAFVSIHDNGSFTGTEAVWEFARLAPGEYRSVSWEVQTSRSIAQDSVLRAPAYAQIDGITEASVEIRTTILARQPVDAGFFDKSFAHETGVYFASDDSAYVQVSDATGNRASDALDSVEVTVSSARTAAFGLAAALPASTDTESVVLTETAADSGIFRGELPFDRSARNAGDGRLFVEPDISLTLDYLDSNGNPLTAQSSAIFQPSTAVFNSYSGEVVPSATVRVLNEDGSPAQFVDGSSNSFTTDSRGEVFIPELSVPAQQSVSLRIEVVAPTGSDLVFPSAVADESLPTQLSSGKKTAFGEGSRGEAFAVDAASPFIGFDLPVDPPEGNLRVDKTSRESEIGVGEIVSYAVVLTNSGKTAVTDIRLMDTPPREFRYLKHSSVVKEAGELEPDYDGVQITWHIARLEPGQHLDLGYRMMVGVDARDGDYVNSVSATGTNDRGFVQSNTSEYRVRVSEGIFTRNGTILGRVFADLDGDGAIDANEPGVARAMVLMEDGSHALTDEKGRYSFRNITPGQHVLRLDRTSLPLTLEPGGAGGHYLDRKDSQWIEMYASGLVKTNFAAVPVSDAARAELLAAKQEGETKTAVSAAPPATRDAAPAPRGTEARTAELRALLDTLDSPELAFVNLVDGQQLPGVHADIRVKFPSGGKLEALLNGQPIDPAHLGAVVENTATGVTLHEYAAVRLSEGVPNTVTVKLTDPFGNARGTKEIRLYTVSAVADIRFDYLKANELVADGMSVVPISATVLNTLKNPAAQLDMITIDVRPARILDDDADPANPGHQLRLKDGVTHFSVRAPREPGESTIKIQADTIERELNIRFLPHLRSLMVVGSGDVVLGAGSVDRNDHEPENVFGDRVEDGVSAGGKLAVFASGAITEKTLLTAAYDSARQKPDDFFHAREQQVDDETIPAITGDASERGYSGSSRDKLFLRLDRDESNVMWGDYRTGIGKDGLSTYDRTFTGMHTEIREGKYRLTGFAAEMLQDQVVDALAANGTSGRYFLSRRLVIFGSERVLVQTRDRLRPDIVLKSEALLRQTDYDIDYYQGSILLRSPVPTWDEGLNPNVLVVTYEVENEENDQWAYGARGEVDLLHGLTLGATGVVEESTIDNYELRGTDLAWHEAHTDTLFKAEYVESNAVLSVNGPLYSVDGSGVRVGFEGTPRERLVYKGYYQDVDRFFVNPSSIDMRPGTRNYGVDASYRLGDLSSLYLQAYDEEDRVLNNEFSHVAGGWKSVHDRFQLGAEIYSDHYDADNVPSSLNDDGQSANKEFDSATGRYPFDSEAEKVSQDLGVKLSIGTHITEKLGINLSHAQDVANTDQSLSYAKLNYDLSEKRSLYYIERYDRYEDRDESRRLAGIESPIAYNTTSFVEYQMADTTSGEQLRRSIGLRNQFELVHGLFGNATYENLDTVSGEAGATRPDGYAVTVSTTYAPTTKWRLIARAEERNETERDTRLGELGFATALGEDFSLLGRTRVYVTEMEDAERREDFRTSLGLAWRPTTNDRFHGLARLDWWKQDQGITLDHVEQEDKLYGSVEGIYQLTPKLAISAKYAGKQFKVDNFELYNDLLAARGSYLLTDRIELGVTARQMTEHDFDNSSLGGAFDIGFNVWKFVWLTVGYSFDDFDQDLTGEGYSGAGAYLKLRFKFDEGTLGDLRSGGH